MEDYPEGIILPVDKPWRWTSADVIRKLKFAAIRHFGNKKLKIGHAGTLDPLASGVLLVCIGKATKLADALQAHEKEYIAGVSFGATTPSYDLEKEPDAIFDINGLDAAAIEAILPRFIGEQMQVAPLFSAKSVDGVRAYETARKLLREGRLDEGSDILKASRITISSLELLGFSRESPPLQFAENPNPKIHVAEISSLNLATATIKVCCSKGTYIRALARDLGEAAGNGAFLSSLRRTRSGDYRIEDCLSLSSALQLLA
ncbi:MAG: tRNA pseudouridine(55) synthase TruB [Bacteroidales bacterium]|nr:tRNA pseudouridine(55) synthase TruB [Bacteroidales bacterium]